MSDSNKEFITVVGKLVLISVVAAALLGITYRYDKIIKKN